MKLTKKQIESVLIEHTQVNADVELLELLRAQLLQKANKGEASKVINDAMKAYRKAKELFDNAINEELTKDREYKECSERAYIQAVRAIDRRYYSLNSFEEYAKVHEHTAFSTLSSLETSLLQVINEHHKASEEFAKQKRSRQSLADRLAEARARLAELEKEAEQSE